MRNFKRGCWIGLFVFMALVGNQILNYILIPNRHARVDLHHLQKDNYEDLYLGTSHGHAAFHIHTLEQETGRKSYNMARGGEYPRDAYYLAKYVAKHQKPKRIIYEIDPAYFVNPDGINNNYNVLFQEMPFGVEKVEYFFAKLYDKDFRVSLFPWFYYRKEINNIESHIKEKQTTNFKNYGVDTFQDENQKFKNNGQMFIRRQEGNEKSENSLIFWDKKELQKDSERYLLKLVELCKKENIEFVALTTPVPRETIEKKPKSFQESDRYFQNLSKAYEFSYYNFNSIPIKDFDPSLKNYNDYDGHMYGDASEEFSKIMWGYLTPKTS